MKPILKVKEISLSGVVNIIRSLRDSRTKHANGLDTTFSLNVQKDGLVCPTAHLINVSFTVREEFFQAPGSRLL